MVKVSMASASALQAATSEATRWAPGWRTGPGAWECSTLQPGNSEYDNLRMLYNYYIIMVENILHYSIMQCIVRFY